MTRSAHQIRISAAMKLHWKGRKIRKVGAIIRWGVLFRSKNKRDGECRHLVCEYSLPPLFNNQSDARDWIESKYGYFRTRADLRAEPHGWKMPIPVRVSISVAP